jgi:regulator of sirC expression with transglutaminase-like and TPR domain
MTAGLSGVVAAKVPGYGMAATYRRYRAGVADDPTERFAALIAQGDGIPLDEACLLIARRARPELDVDAERARLDELADGVAGTDADAVVRHLCVDLGFAGDRATYHDARNSLLPDVLDRRLGIPISLAIVAIEVARRRGITLLGVGMPGHFLVREEDDPDHFVDLFDGGRSLDATGCREVFEHLHPRVEWHDGFLAPVGPSAIVARVLANLANAHRRAGDRDGLAATLDLRLLVPGATLRDRRELAVLLGSMGRFAQGAEVLEATGEDADRESATRLRARLN